MRDIAIQQIRVAAMLIIVFYHCVCYYGIWDAKFPEALRFDTIEYWRALCNVALNAFVFISGLLYAKLYFAKEKYRDSKAMFRDKVRRLLVPYCIWVCLALLIFPSEHTILDFLSGAQHLWFLLMLMSIFAAIIALGGKALNIKTLIGGVIAFSALNIVIAKYGDSWPNIAAWKTAVKYMPAFIIGMLTVRLRIAERMSGWPKWTIVVTFCITALLVAFMGYMPSLPFGLLYVTIPTYCFLICLYVLLSAYPMRFGTSTFNSLDKQSMGIYIIHHLLIWGILLYIPGAVVLMNAYPVLAPILLFGIVFFVAWVASELLHKTDVGNFLLGGYTKRKI